MRLIDHIIAGAMNTLIVSGAILTVGSFVSDLKSLLMGAFAGSVAVIIVGTGILIFRREI